MKASFQKNGYFKTKINPRSLSLTAEHDLNILQNNFDSLTRDPYSDVLMNRYRAYSNLVIIPWERKPLWIPPKNVNGQYVSSYWQGKFNPEHAESSRSFTPISSDARNTSLLRNLILHDFDLTFWDNKVDLPIYVGVHLVKLQVLDKAQIAYSSPDLMHRDGEAFTFAHLFNRYNIKGGKNYISPPEYANNKLEDVPTQKILTEFEMYEPLESYGVCDEMVSHYVSPIEMDNGDLTHGCREIILIDFSSVQQQLG
jgi:hypothetical protein